MSDNSECITYYSKINAERKRTGIGAIELSKYVTLPSRMNFDRFRNIIDGKIQHIKASEYNFILKAYALFPNSERVSLTVRKINRIKRDIEEKNVSKANISKSFPRYEKFNVGILRSWLNGSVTSAKKSHYEGVKAFIENHQPIKTFDIYKSQIKNETYVPISKDLQDFIKSEIERTGIGPQRALKGNKEAKEAGLTSGIIYRIIGQNGHVRKVKKQHTYLLKTLWK